jgi:mRNA interferase RelE/StbE
VSYQITWSKNAHRHFLALDKPVQHSVAALIGKLAGNPRPASLKAVVGMPGVLRVRAGAAVAAWPAVALVGSYELLMMIIRGAQSSGVAAGTPSVRPAPEQVADSLQARAAEEFAGHIAAGAVPSIRVIRATLHVGEPRAQQVRAHLAAAARQAAA